MGFKYVGSDDSGAGEEDDLVFLVLPPGATKGGGTEKLVGREGFVDVVNSLAANAPTGGALPDAVATDEADNPPVDAFPVDARPKPLLNTDWGPAKPNVCWAAGGAAAGAAAAAEGGGVELEEGNETSATDFPPPKAPEPNGRTGAATVTADVTFRPKGD